MVNLMPSSSKLVSPRSSAASAVTSTMLNMGTTARLSTSPNTACGEFAAMRMKSTPAPSRAVTPVMISAT